MSSIRLKKDIVERKKKSLIKLGIFAAVLLILCLAVYLSADRTAPTLDFTNAASVYSLDEGTALDMGTFLQGVKALDNVDGDLTDRIAIKSMRQNADSSISVIYCVRDNSGNLTVEERIYNLNMSGGTIQTSGNDTAQLPEDDQTSPDVPEEISEESGAEQLPEDTQEVPAQATEAPPAQPAETEPSVQEQPQESETRSAKPVITLNATEVHIAAGEGFYYPGYIAEMWDDVDTQTQLYNSIWIENYELVDWNTPGVYTLIYRLVDSDKNISDGQTLTVYIE